MNSELRELYQEVILDHNKRPRNKGRLERPTNSADGYNPLCGDRVHLELEIVDGIIRSARFEGQGCAISTASASMMAQAVTGKSLADAEALFDKMQALLTSGAATGAGLDDELMALSGVRDYPVRIKCAILPWHALREAISNTGGVATTE